MANNVWDLVNAYNSSHGKETPAGAVNNTQSTAQSQTPSSAGNTTGNSVWDMVNAYRGRTAPVTQGYVSPYRQAMQKYNGEDAASRRRNLERQAQKDELKHAPVSFDNFDAKHRQWMQGVKGLASGFSAESGKYKDKDAAGAYADRVRAQMQGLGKEGSEMLGFLMDNRSRIGEDVFNDYVDSVRSGITWSNDISNAAGAQIDYWGKWDSKEAYDADVARKQAYAEFGQSVEGLSGDEAVSKWNSILQHAEKDLEDERNRQTISDTLDPKTIREKEQAVERARQGLDFARQMKTGRTGFSMDGLRSAWDTETAGLSEEEAYKRAESELKAAEAEYGRFNSLARMNGNDMQPGSEDWYVYQNLGIQAEGARMQLQEARQRFQWARDSYLLNDTEAIEKGRLLDDQLIEKEHAGNKEYWSGLTQDIDQQYQFSKSDYYAHDTDVYHPTDDWTDEEKNLYYAYLGKGMNDEARVYAANTNAAKRQEMRDEQTAGWKQYGRDGGFISGAAGIGMQVVSMAPALFEFLDKAEEVHGRGGLYVGSETAGVSNYTQALVGGKAEKLNEYGTIGGKGLGDAYQLAGSIAQSMISGNLAGEFGTLLLFFGQAANSGFDEAIQRGASGDQAVLMGTMTGIAETLGEKLSLENLLDEKKLATRGMLTYILSQAGIEGSEEGFTDIMNLYADRLVMGNKSELMQNIDRNLSEGMSYDEARRVAWTDYAKGVAWDVIGGVASGGVSGTLQTGVQVARYGDAIRQELARRNPDAQVSYQTTNAMAQEAAGFGLSQKQLRDLEENKETVGKLREDIKTGRLRSSTVENKNARVKVGDKQGQISGMRYQDGTAVVELKMDDGSTTTMGVDEMRDLVPEETYELLYEAAGLGRNAPAVFQAYDSKQSIGSYIDAMSAGIDLLAAEGLDRAYMDTSPLTQGLTTEQKDIAWEIGNQRFLAGGAKAVVRTGEGRVSFDGDNQGQAAARRAWGRDYRKNVRLASFVAKATGLNVVFFDSTQENGKLGSVQGMYKQDGAVYIDIHAGQNVNGVGDIVIARTMSHELTHFLEKAAPAEYKLLRRFVTENLAKGGVFEALVLNKRGTDYEDNVNELVADACEMMLLHSEAIQKLASEHYTVAEKVYEHIKSVFQKMLKAVSPKSVEAVVLRGKYDEMSKLWDAALEKAVENTRRAVENGEAITPEQELEFSLRENEKFMTAAEEYNKKNGSKVDAKTMAAARKARQIIADAFNDPSRVLNLPEDVMGNTFISNSSYGGTEENTTVCIRSLAAQALMDQIGKALGRPLTVDETLLLSQEIANYTDKPECFYCYVATDRRAYREYLNNYLQQRADVLKKYRPDMTAEQKQALYEEFLDGRKDTKNMKARFNLWVNTAQDQLITGSDLASVDELAQRIADLQANKHRTAAENSTLRQLKDAAAYAQSASWAKKIQGYTAYNGHILKWNQAKINDFNSHYGLRMYSFSDFSAAFILENMQMVTDASVKGLKMLAYTKELAFAEIFAQTGMNINISVYASHANGQIIKDGMQGADWDGAIELRKKYPNVGLTLVATSDDIVEWGLQNPDIDVVIPYHLVRTGQAVADYFGFRNYTSESADGKIAAAKEYKGKPTSVYPSVHQNDLVKYVRALQEYNLTPRFERYLTGWQEFLAGDMSEADFRAANPYYMKLVNETRRSAGETPAVQPIFNTKAATDAIDLMERKGGYGIAEVFGRSADFVMEDITDTVVEKIQERQQARLNMEAVKEVGVEAARPEVAFELEAAVQHSEREDGLVNPDGITYDGIGERYFAYDEGNRPPDLTPVETQFRKWDDKAKAYKYVKDVTIRFAGDRPKGYIPARVGKAYKVMEMWPDGTVHPLFAGADTPIEFGNWQWGKGYQVEGLVKTMGLRPRYAWHISTLLPTAAHLMGVGDSLNPQPIYPSKGGPHPKGSKRVWVELEYDASTDYNGLVDTLGSSDGDVLGLMPFGGYYVYKEKNMSEWVLSSGVRFTRVLDEAERQQILKDAGYDEYEAWQKGKLSQTISAQITSTTKALAKETNAEKRAALQQKLDRLNEIHSQNPYAGWKAPKYTNAEGVAHLQQVRESVASRIYDNPDAKSQRGEVQMSERRTYQAGREVLAKKSLDDLSKKLGDRFPLSANFDKTISSDNSSLTSADVVVNSGRPLRGEDKFRAGKRIYQKNYGTGRTVVSLPAVGINANMTYDFVRESLAKVTETNDIRVTLDLIPQLKELLENGKLLGIERVHVDNKHNPLYGYRIFNTYNYNTLDRSGKIINSEQRIVTAMVVQSLDNAHSYVFRDIKSAPAGGGSSVPGSSAFASRSTISNVSQLYRAVKRIPRKDGGLKYTTEEADDMLFFYTTRNDGTAYSLRDDSPEFRRWFGNSKVVNPDGTPKIVYHQTGGDFTVFNTDNPVAGANDSETPNGIFFKENDHDIGLEGKKQMAVYLSVQNPLRFADRKEANAWYQKHIAGYKTLQDEMDSKIKPLSDRMDQVENDMFQDDVSQEQYDALDKQWNDMLEEMHVIENDYRGRLRNLLDEYFLRNDSGYDGIELGYDGHRYVNGKRENVHTWIIFRNTQVKSATNNVGTFDSNNPDIRFSRRDDTSTDTAEETAERVHSYNRLRADNEALRRQVERLKKELKPTTERTVRRADAMKIAREMLGGLRYSITANDLADVIERIGNYLVGSDTEALSYDEMIDMARGIARKMVESAEEPVMTGMEDINQTLRQYLNGIRLTISKDNVHDLGSESLTAWKKYNPGIRVGLAENASKVGSSGPKLRTLKQQLQLAQDGQTQTVTVGSKDTGHAVPVDVAYMELQEMLGEGLLPSDVTHPADQLNRISELLQDSAKEQWRNPFQGYEGEAIESTAQQIVEAAMGEALRQSAPTYADRAQQRLDKEKAKGKLKLQEQREKDQARLEEMQAKNRERIAEIKRNAQARVEETRAKERAKKWERVDSLRERYQQQAKRAAERRKESRKSTELRGKIRKLHADMTKRLLRPSENKYIPAELVKAVANMLETVDITSGKSQKMTDAFNELRLQYHKLADKTETNGMIDPVIEEMLGKLGDRLTELKSTSIYELSSADLKQIYDTMRALDHTVRYAVKLIRYQGEKDAFEIAEGMIDETRDARPISPLVKKWLLASMRPETFFKAMAGYAKDSNWSAMADMLDQAQLYQTQLQMEGAAFFDELMNDTKAFEKLTDTKDLLDIGLKDEDGNAVLVTRDIAIKVYLDTLAEENARHLMYGAYSMPDIKMYYKKGGADAYNRGVRVQGYGVRLSELRHQLNQAETEDQKQVIEDQIKEAEDEAQQWVADIRQAISSQLGEYEHKWIKAWTDFAKFSQDVLNKTTMEVYGFEKATVDFYVPIHTDKNFRAAQFESITKDMSLENVGFMKERVPSASNPMLGEGIVDVASRQIDNMAKYAAMMPAIRDFQKVYSKGKAGFADSVQNAVSRVFGADAVTYIENILTDLTSQRSSGDGLLNDIANRLRGNLAAASLTLNPRVALSQAASYPTAAAVVGWKPLIKAFRQGANPVRNEQARQEIARWSPLYELRMEGYFDREVGDMRKDKSLVARINRKLSFLSNWIQTMDGATVGRLWYAAQAYVEEHNKDLEKGSDAFMQESARIFNRIVEETQPNYTTFQRPDVLRNPNALVKQLTMFLTQRLQNANILFDAVGTYNAAARDLKNGSKHGTTEADLREARTNLTNAVSSQLAAAATISIFKAFADALMYSMKKYRDDDDELTAESVLNTLINNAFESIASNFLGGSELYSLARSIFTGERYYGNSIGAISTVGDFAEQLVSYAQDPSEKNLRRLLTLTSQLAGVPLQNASKFYNAVMLRVQDAREGNGTWSFASEIEQNNFTQARSLYKALQAGDTTKVAELEEALGGKRQAQQQIAAYVKKQFEAGKMEESEAFDALRKHAGYSEDDAFWAIRKIQGGKDYSMWGDLEKAAREGNRTAFDEAADYLGEHGKDSGDVRTHMKSAVHDWYTSSEKDRPMIPKADAEKLLIQYAGMSRWEAQNQVREWTIERVHGFTYSEIQDRFVDGDLAYSKAVDLLYSYGPDAGTTGAVAKMSREEAREKVDQWRCEKETGISYSKIQDAFIQGDITEAQAVNWQVKYGHKDQADAEQRVLEWSVAKDYGGIKFGSSEYGIKDALIQGRISAETAKTIMMTYGGNTEEEAAAYTSQYEFERDTGYNWSDGNGIREAMRAGYNDEELTKWEAACNIDCHGSMQKAQQYVKIAHWLNDVPGCTSFNMTNLEKWEKNQSRLASAGLGKEAFAEASAVYNSEHSDYDSTTGESIEYSKCRKVMAYINSMDLTRSQKTALALSLYSKEYVNKCATW